MWKWLQRFRAPPPHPLVGRRFCKVQMDGCMAHIRGKEQWGYVRKVTVAVSDPSDRRCQVVGDTQVYDGGQSEASRDELRLRGQSTYARVVYDDGAEFWEPVWWFTDKATHLEYQY
jgi:hypothetical protein